MTYNNTGLSIGTISAHLNIYQIVSIEFMPQVRLLPEVFISSKADTNWYTFSQSEPAFRPVFGMDAMSNKHRIFVSLHKTMVLVGVGCDFIIAK